ncbi:rhodanese-like domain-containing protein [Buchnera aphidicola]|uniref:rhodanese-like domain-containing protein n=1 Tax=Buchnera aphidicola TaxID=9 RepID=UPI0034642BFE
MKDIIFFISEHYILSSIWFFLLIITILLIIKNLCLKFKFINNTEAIKLINKNNALVIDTRSLDLFQKGHIINSIHIPLKNFSLKYFKENNLYKSSPIILIFNETDQYNKCIHEFIKHGFNHIYILKNGIYCWNSDHLPLVVKN